MLVYSTLEAQNKHRIEGVIHEKTAVGNWFPLESCAGLSVPRMAGADGALVPKGVALFVPMFGALVSSALSLMAQHESREL